MINMLEAKTSLSRLVRAIENGETEEIIIARNGHPAARLVPVRAKAKGQRIGVAKGRWTMPDDIDEDNELILRMFDREEE